MKKIISLILLLALLLSGCSFEWVPPTQPPEPGSTVSGGSTLQVHFLDVGQADCALLECDGEFMLIDGGNRADSSLVVSYLEKQGVEELEVLVNTHPHEDHVGGLPGVLAVYPVKAVYGSSKTYSSNIYDSFMHYIDQQGLELVIPEPGHSFTLGSATVTVLGPVKSYAEWNDTSIVLMVQFGSTRFLFTGDMESTAEQDLLDAGTDVKADVLKVGHHGSYTSTGYRFLYEVDPTYAVISCGRDNDYGHPHEEPLSRLEDAEVAIYRTDEMGTVIATSDGQSVSFTWEFDVNGPGGTAEEIDAYIGNANTKKFHLSSCTGLPEEQNWVFFTTYDNAVSAGFTPCSRCLP